MGRFCHSVGILTPNLHLHIIRGDIDKKCEWAFFFSEHSVYDIAYRVTIRPTGPVKYILQGRSSDSRLVDSGCH